MTDHVNDVLSSLLPGGKGVWIPMDHGLSSYPVKGLVDIDSAVDDCISAGANAIILQKGTLSHQLSRTRWDNFVMHVSASTIHGGENAGRKMLVGTAKEAHKRGASALSCQINLGDNRECEMIESVGALTTSAMKYTFPVLGMVYQRGPNLLLSDTDATNGVAHAARVAWELGCHVAKVPWTGDAESFAEVSSAVPIPILIAGGPNVKSFNQTLEIVENAVSSGASGVCMGRQVFSSPNRKARIRALKAIVHEGASADQAATLLG